MMYSVDIWMQSLRQICTGHTVLCELFNQIDHEMSGNYIQTWKWKHFTYPVSEHIHRLEEITACFHEATNEMT